MFDLDEYLGRRIPITRAMGIRFAGSDERGFAPSLILDGYDRVKNGVEDTPFNGRYYRDEQSVGQF
jgi:hypothetical protein